MGEALKRVTDARPAERFLSDVGAHVQERFVGNRVIQSFAEYLDLFFRDPRRHARSSAQYLRDAMDFYGHQQVETPVGSFRRFKLFDGDGSLPGEGLGPDVHVIGQEEAQNAIYRQLSNFVRAGRINKLIMLHGPNGSAKTSLISALARGLEDYSRRPEGARYRFNWVFPSEKLVKGSIGFGGRPGDSSGDDSFAHLEAEVIEAIVQCELKDPPLFLIPRDERRAMLREATRPSERGSEGENDFILSDYILDGELCQKCRAIYSALLAHHNGDYLKILRHVQVERFYVSRRYLSGAAVVEPQMSVDADYRQVAADRSHGALPPALQNLALYEPSGALIAGNRGLVELSDLLKRPIEAYKYLLGTCETATVPLGPFVAQLDAVLIATSNEKHLGAFKEIPDFASFKARIELIRVPYLRRMSVETQIYSTQLDKVTVGKHIAPHSSRVAALWAVLTRLKKPMSERYKGTARSIIDDLVPYEKMALYDTGTAPDRLSLAQAKELRSQLHALYHESDSYPNYEGGSGASAREMKTVLFNAAQHPQYKCLTPFAVIEELTELVKDRSVYEFLQQERVDDFHAHEELVRVAESDCLDCIEEEIRDSMGLVSEKQYRELFERYVQHVSAGLKGEKIQNRLSGVQEVADEELMASTEAIIMARGQDRREFRRSLITTVGAYRLDHPDAEIEYSQIFPDLFRHLRDHYFDERKKTLRRNKEDMLRYLSDDRDSLLDRDRQQVEQTLALMRSRYGYCEHCAKDAIIFLMRKRYSD